MDIKSRLRVSYIAMFMIPAILICISGWLVHEITGFEGKYEAIKERNPVLKASILGQRVLEMVNYQILEDPDQLIDIDYIKKLEKDIDVKGVGVIVRKDEEVIYVPPYLEESKDEIYLIPFKNMSYGNQDIFDNKKDIALIKLYDFYFTDRSEGSIFLAVNTGEYKRDLTNWQYGFLILTVIILISTNGVITVLLYRSIIKPLKELERASNAVKEGDLDYKIQNDFRDEFGDVMTSFEEMRKRLKSSLERQQQYEENRKLMISNIAHDLKTPITSIQGYIEGIRDGVADTPEKMKKYTDTIYRKAEDMNGLIEDLFLFSKLDLQNFPFDFKLLNMVDYIKDIGEELIFDLEKKDIELKLQYPSKKIMVNGDGNNLRRAIMNVIDNSIKYAGAIPLKIEIIVKEREKDVLIEIKDNGKGISEDAMPLIFEKFYRADPSRNTNTGGSGLGLAIVKKIIEEHGGEVWAESEINKGTRVSFTLRKR